MIKFALTLLMLLLNLGRLHATSELRLTAETESLAAVYDCVNAISGDFFHRQTDMVLGVEPLSYTTCYDSGHVYSSPKGYGIGSQFPFYMKYVTEGFKNKEIILPVAEREGFYLPYLRSIQNGSFCFTIHPKVFSTGYTNYSDQGISAQNNIQNRLIKLLPDYSMEVSEGSGLKRLYRPYRKFDETRNAEVTQWHLVQEIRPNGNKLLFDYDNPGFPKRITATNAAETATYGWMEFSYDASGYTLTSSQDHQIRYNTSPIDIHHRQRSRGHNLEWWTRDDHLTQLLTSQGIDTTFEISASAKEGISRQITRICKPEGRYLRIDYGKGDKAGKVISLHAPLGGSSDPVLLGAFSYPNANTTEVRNSYGTKTTYRSESSRIVSVEKYNQNDTLHSARRYLWDNDRLKARGLANAQGKFVEVIAASYDERGNITTEEIFGNFSGTVPDDFDVDANFRPLSNTECRKINFEYSQDGFNLLLKEQHSDGKVIQYSYLPGTNLLSEKLVSDGKNVYSHQVNEYQDGLLTCTITDGEIKRISRYPNGYPENITESYLEQGREKLLKRIFKHYDGKSQLIQEDIFDASDLLSYSLKYFYDQKGNLIQETDPIGRVTKYEYDANKNKIYQELVEGGYGTVFIYDLSNRLIEEREYHNDSSILITRYSYDYLGNCTSVTDSFGNQTQYHFDEFGRQISKVLPLGGVEQKEYDIVGNVIAETNPSGDRTATQYNVLGKPTLIQYPDGTEERFQYNLNGTLARKWDVHGVCTQYTYDILGRVIKTECGTRTTQNIYIGKNLVQAIDAMGFRTDYGYDGAGRRISEQTQTTSKTFAYDSLGRLSCTTQGDVRIVDEFDSLGRVSEKRTENLQGDIQRRECFEYDIRDNQTVTKKYIDAENFVLTETRYDTRNRPVLITDPLGQRTLIHNFERYPSPVDSSAFVLRKTFTDPMDGKTIEVYDSMDRITSTEKLGPNDQRLAYQQNSYDSCGRKVRQEDDVILSGLPKGTYVITWRYDSMNRVVYICEQNSKNTYYTYAKGLLATKVKPDGVTLHYSYNDYGKLQQLSSSDGSIAYRYAYDDNDNLISAMDLINNREIIRQYHDNHLSLEILANGHRVDYSYINGRLDKVHFQDKKAVQYKYDGVNLSHVSRLDSSGKQSYQHCYKDYDWRGLCHRMILPFNVCELTLRYDALGRPVSIDSPHWAEILHEYDAVGNLKKATVKDPKGSMDHQFEYDGLYQLVREAGAITQEYVCDSIGNQISSEQEVNHLNQLTSTFTYDQNGNIVAGDHTYQYDALDRLVQADAVSYSYDAFGRRLTRSTDKYIYQNQDEIGSESEFRVMSKGLTVAIEKGGHVYAPIHDHRGNICCLINCKNGRPEEFYRYSAYEQTETIGTVNSPWGLSGKRFDRHTKLWHFGKRDYNSELRRWMTPDPAGFVDGCNLYAYLMNRPFRYTDPDGRFVIALPLFVWGGAVGVAWVLPSITTIACTAAVLWGFQEGCKAIDSSVSKTEWREEKFPGAPQDLEKDSRWEEISHPQARGRGRRRFKNRDTGEILEYDKGRPGEPGHRGHDHYHRPNPRSDGRSGEEYLDHIGNPCSDGSNRSHLYPPKGIQWE
ncbi:MAG: RHS repeat-associated core domain-containing protein [Chlamydiales bacterium]|nr:RHS repeat-associated core domain-containing protein [Chlamydiales bacterium]